jgi:hypothetical protein
VGDVQPSMVAAICERDEESLLVPLSVILNTPSRGTGISAPVEQELRIFGAERCQVAGQILKLPQVTIVSSQVIFHRFYYRKSFANFNLWRIVAVALFLASKMEETHRRLRDILTTVYMLEQHDQGQSGILDPGGNTYSDLKAEVVKYERYVLRELGFEIGLVLHHPHKFILQYTNYLMQDNADQSSEAPKQELARKAWGYLNDSMRTPLCCHMPAHAIAVGAIALAARNLDLPLPKAPPWWEAFDVQEENLNTVMQTMYQLYVRPKATYKNVVVKEEKIAIPNMPGTPAVMSPSPPANEDAVPARKPVPVGSTRPAEKLNEERIAEMLSEETNGAGARANGAASFPPPEPRRSPPPADDALDERRGRDREDDRRRDDRRARDDDRRRDRVELRPVRRDDRYDERRDREAGGPERRDRDDRKAEARIGRRDNRDDRKKRDREPDQPAKRPRNEEFQ